MSGFIVVYAQGGVLSVFLIEYYILVFFFGSLSVCASCRVGSLYTERLHCGGSITVPKRETHSPKSMLYVSLVGTTPSYGDKLERRLSGIHSLMLQFQCESSTINDSLSRYHRSLDLPPLKTGVLGKLVNKTPCRFLRPLQPQAQTSNMRT